MVIKHLIKFIVNVLKQKRKLLHTRKYFLKSRTNCFADFGNLSKQKKNNLVLLLFERQGNLNSNKFLKLDVFKRYNQGLKNIKQMFKFFKCLRILPQFY